MIFNYQKCGAKCDADGCDVEVVQGDLSLSENCKPAKPWVPFGWISINDSLFCERHNVKIVVDGEVVLEPKWR